MVVLKYDKYYSPGFSVYREVGYVNDEWFLELHFLKFGLQFSIYLPKKRS